MFSYYSVKYVKDGQITNTVMYGLTDSEIVREFKQENPEFELKEVKKYPDLSFNVVKPLKVEKTIHGYSVKKQFFKEGFICVDVFDKTYFIKYKPYEETIIKIENDHEIYQIGEAIFLDSEGKVISTIILEEIDEGHLIDRLTADVIKINESI